jgi:hypothetical protein
MRVKKFHTYYFQLSFKDSNLCLLSELVDLLTVIIFVQRTTNGLCIRHIFTFAKVIYLLIAISTLGLIKIF